MRHFKIKTRNNYKATVHRAVKNFKSLIYQAASNSILPRGTPRGTLQSPSWKIWRNVFLSRLQYPNILRWQAFSMEFSNWSFVTYLFPRILKIFWILKIKENYFYLFRETVLPFGQYHVSSLNFGHWNPAARDAKTVNTEFSINNKLERKAFCASPMYNIIFRFVIFSILVWFIYDHLFE